MRVKSLKNFLRKILQ